MVTKSKKEPKEDSSDNSVFRVFDMGRWKVIQTHFCLKFCLNNFSGGKDLCCVQQTIHLEEEVGEMLEWNLNMQWQMQTGEEEREKRGLVI